MSGAKHTGTSSIDADRRFQRTRAALHGAFVRLFLGRRYDQIRVGDIIDDADVARSTFYEHYRGKDDLLLQSMSWMLDVMARTASEDEEVAGLEMLMRHFWENKSRGRYLLAGPPAQHVLPRLSRELAKRIEQHLESRQKKRSEAPVIPLRLVAAQAAEAQFALIRAWLAGEDSCTPAELAIGLRRSTHGAIAAILPNGT